MARIEVWALSYAITRNVTLAKIRQYFGPGQSQQYPTLRYLQVRNLAQQDVYELGLRYYTARDSLQAQNTAPFAPINGLPYSNAIRAGDYIYTSLFGGHYANATLAPLENRVEQAYRNMIAAAAFFGAEADDLYHVEATTTSLARDQSAVDDASRRFFGLYGPFPTRAMQEQPAVLLGETFEVSGIFYFPKCRCA